jgi:uncharacterized protein (TIGR01370 family)
MPLTGMYVLQGVDPAAVAAAPFDVKVVEIYDDDGNLFSAAQVREMGGGPGGGSLIGYFSLGEAESYRDYFATLPAADIGPQDPGFPGDFEVAYWTEAWKSIVRTYVDRMIGLGYDGIFFDVVDEFQQPWAQAHAPGGDAQGAMIALVEYAADYARAKAPGFQIWVNGAEELLADPGYLATLTGLYKENIFYTDSGAPQPPAETAATLALLAPAIAARKPVIAVEYVSGAAAIADVHAKAAAAGIGSYVAHPDLDGIDYDGVTPCFRAGTRLRTPAGARRVETLSPGDEVLTAAGAARPVIWVGHRRVACARHPDPHQVWPVRIAAEAFAAGCPERDLWLSPDHAVFVEGGLVPVKLLVNGASIAQAPCPRVTYHHVELAQHDLVLAEGLPVETYLDTGNRAMFANAGEAAARGTALPAAPLVTDEARVRPIWERLAARAGPLPRASFTQDAALRLMADGRAIWPVRSGRGRLVFPLPRGTRRPRLMSRIGHASDSRPWAEDRRRLGVQVRGLAYTGPAGRQAIPLDHPSLSQGWWSPEAAGAERWRWTDGDAAVPLPPGAWVLEVALGEDFTYRLPPAPPRTRGKLRDC